VMPWARISRVTFARSTTSGVGLHTNVTACPASFSVLHGYALTRGNGAVPEPSL
jgi:hypothetical protein